LPENRLFSLDEDLALLSQATKNAGKIALQFFGRDPQVWMKKGDKSPVSEADFAVDHYLKQSLLQARPDYGWISEESVDERQKTHYRHCFVVDPIDGTRGFINGSLQWCISVAIIRQGKPACGVLECPALGEHYRAHLAMRTTLNDNTLEPSSISDYPDKIRISCTPAKTRDWLQDLREKLVFVSSSPSLAYRLALSAAGKLDVVVVRPNSHDWDLAAADIILSQSGNNLMTLQNEPVSYGHAPFIHDFLLAGPAHYREQIAPFLSSIQL